MTMPLRRPRGAAIPAGTWAAAGNQFRKLRPPVSLPVEAFNTIRRVQIGGNGVASGVISAAPATTVPVGPQGYGTRWYPAQVSIATKTGANDTSTCAFYLNVAGPGGFLGQSYAGGGDQLGFAVPEMQPGDLLYAVWSGGTAGDWAQVTVTGSMDILVP
jgi:hypothetical protein